MDKKKPLSQATLKGLIFLIFSLTCFGFWYYTHHIVNNYYKYGGYVAGFLLASSKEIFKKDEETKQWKVQPLGHWLFPFIGLCLVCGFSVVSEFKEAHDKKENANIETLQHRAEQAEHKAEVETLLRQLAEQKTLLIASEGKAETRAQRQHQEAEKIRTEQKMLSSQNTLEQKLQFSRTQLVEKEQNAETRREQHAEVIRAEVSQATQSVHDLMRSLNPIQNVAVAYQIQIPLDDPQMSQYRSDLNNAVQKFLANGKRIDGSSPFAEYRVDKFFHPISVASSLLIRRGSTLYPADPASLRADLFTYPVELRFWKKLYRYKSGFIGGPSDRLPDLLISTVADKLPPDVFYDLTRKRLYFMYKGAFLPRVCYALLIKEAALTSIKMAKTTKCRAATVSGSRS